MNGKNNSKYMVTRKLDQTMEHDQNRKGKDI